MKRGLYRGLNQDTGRWAHGNLLTWKDEMYICVLAGKRIMRVKVPNYSVGEWTGCKDSTGRDIYEGDILLTPAGRKIVVTRECGAGGWYFNCGNSVLHNCTIIGDINSAL